MQRAGGALPNWDPEWVPVKPIINWRDRGVEVGGKRRVSPGRTEFNCLGSILAGLQGKEEEGGRGGGWWGLGVGYAWV